MSPHSSIAQKIQREQAWHESEDFLRDDSALIVGVYASPVFREAEEYHINALGNVSGLRVLDYGCGTGGTTSQLVRRGARVTGFDISETRLHDARKLLQRNGWHADLAKCSAEELPYADGSFDAILGKQILHHLDLGVAVSELARVLKPGGRAVFLEPLIHNPILEGYRRMTPHLRSPTEKALSFAQIDGFRSYFRSVEHREFILLSVLPALANVVFKSKRWQRLYRPFQTIDRRLMDAHPRIASWGWETVITLMR